MNIDWFKLVIALVLLLGLAIYFFNSYHEIQIKDKEIQLKEEAAKPNRFDKYYGD